MKHCKRCGKEVTKKFTYCWSCYQIVQSSRAWDEYAKKTPEERDIENAVYYSHECSMCGKEGANYHGEQLFCGRCWAVWNS